MKQNPLLHAALLALAAALPAQALAGTYSEVGNSQDQDSRKTETSAQSAEQCEQYRRETNAILDSIPGNLDPESKKAMQHLSADQKERLKELRSLRADCS